MKPKIVFAHFHEGNDPDHARRKGHVYATRAAVIDLESGLPLDEAWAYCTKKDAPRRAVGRQIALGRLKKKVLEVSGLTAEWAEAIKNTPQLKLG